MTSRETKEDQYEDLFDVENEAGRFRMGLMSNQTWYDDPKRLGFQLARYKFVARMLEGKNSVLEVGCADAFGIRVVQQFVPKVTAIDFDPLFIEDAQARIQERWTLDLRVHDILRGPVEGPFDAAFSLDVLEHIDPADEGTFIKNLAGSIVQDGIAIIGMPTLESQVHASSQSRRGHVNCKSGNELRETMLKSFQNVFIFSMNDEVVHTGFHAMAHYLFALCCGVR
tara:strand:+ start:169 stop:846 length:678 start_codon:yes stop_codon:yes gene_type:complete